MKRYLTPEELSFILFVNTGGLHESKSIEINYGRQSGHTTSIVGMFDKNKDLILCDCYHMKKHLINLFGSSTYEKSINIVSNFNEKYFWYGRSYRYIFVDNYSYLLNIDKDLLEHNLKTAKYDFCVKLG